jgi:phage terminase large subunit-like protein
MHRRELDRRLRYLLSREPGECAAHIAALEPGEQREIPNHWRLFARKGQLPPAGDWHTWLILAGRGFGKTRAGAEWVRELAEADPAVRIALVGATFGEARAVMVEGDSGILAVCPPGRRPSYEPTLRRLTWPNGAQATLFSAGEPDSLRGPQHSHAWCDEIAKWETSSAQAERCWDNLMLGLRLGEHPRCLATTTPRAVPLVRRLIGEMGTGLVRTGGPTEENLTNLPERFVRGIRRRYAGSLLARQELDGELVADLPGALWTRGLLEACREPAASAPAARTVIGVDPPASTGGDECGIVVCALGEDGIARVLADLSVANASPERWARAVARGAAAWRADRVVAEANQGGTMVASVLRAAEVSLPLKLVHARVGKAARAEPVAALYEAGRVRHAGEFPALEDQLCGLIAGGRYEGPGRSPDRADAAVWALSELMLAKPRAQPRVWLG